MRRFTSIPCMMLLLLLWGGSAGAESFYSYRDSRGVIHFSNIRSDRRYVPIDGGERKVMRRRMDVREIHRTAERVASKYDVDPHLIKAIIKAESDFDPDSVSRAGAQGLMQLMPETAAQLNVQDPYDPVQSIEGGVRYFKWLLGHFQNDVKLALAAYNSGRTTVLKYGGIPPYKETQDYVRKVLDYYSDFRRM